MTSSEAPTSDLATGYPSAELIYERLLLAKMICDHAVAHSLQPDPLDKVLALHGFHYSLEILLRTIALQWQLDADKFTDIVATVNTHARKKLNLTLPYKNEVNELNNWRNLAQHGAIEPPDQLLSKWVALVPQFLSRVAMDFLAIDIDNLTQLDLITNHRLKDLLKKAEEYCALVKSLADPSTENDEAYRYYQTALAILAICFAIAFGESKAYVGRSAYDRLVDVPPSLLFLEADTVPSELWRRTRELELASLFNVIGVDYWKYQELVEHAPEIALDQGHEPWICVLNEARPDPQQLSRLIDFETRLLRYWIRKGIIQATTTPGDDPFRLAGEAILQGRHLNVTGVDDATNVTLQFRMNLGTIMLQGYRQYETSLTGTL